MVNTETSGPDTKKITVFKKFWGLFIDWCVISASLQITLGTFPALGVGFLTAHWLDTPGRGEGFYCQGPTRHMWCTHLCAAAAIFFDMDSTYKKCKMARKAFFKHLIPDWEAQSIIIQRLGPLWRGSAVKFWVGERVWWLGFDKAFPFWSRLSEKFCLKDCNLLQTCCLVDWWLYNTLSRQGEVLRTKLLGAAGNRHLGLYWQNLANKDGVAPLIRDDALFACGWTDAIPRYRGSVGIVGWFDHQKNDACAAKNALNNRWVLNLSVEPSAAMCAIGTRADASNKKLFEVIRSLGSITLTDEYVELPYLGNAIFPNMNSKEMVNLLLNLTAEQIEKIRQLLYEGVISARDLAQLSGHCWIHRHRHRAPLR